MSRVDTVDICRCKMMYSQLWDVKMLILADWELLSDLKSFYSKARVGHQRVAVQIPRRQFSMTRCTWCWIAVDWISLLQVGLSENIWKWDIPPLPNYHISSTYHHNSSYIIMFPIFHGHFRGYTVYTRYTPFSDSGEKDAFCAGVVTLQRGSSTWNAMANLWSSWALHRRQLAIR